MMSRLSPSGFKTRVALRGRTLLIDLGTRQRVLSSGPRGGGWLRSRYILNHQVDANPIAAPSASRRVWGDAARYLGKVAAALDVTESCAALMTAVPLRHLVAVRDRCGAVWLEAFVTVGASNAVRAGERPRVTRVAASQAGTINIILVTNARLASAAMVGVVQVATESKTAALLAQNVRSWTGRRGATGTGTDAIVVAGGEGPPLRYSGTHTEFGAMVGRLVFRGVTAGLCRWRRWARTRR